MPTEPTGTVEVHYANRILRDDRGAVVACAWYALCDYPATAIVPHQTLADIPICGHCAGGLD